MSVPVPVVALPGMMCDQRLWAPQQRFLKQAGHSLVFPDIAACDSIPDMAEQVLCSVSGSISLMGLSMGGIVALEVIRRAPERVARLAILNSNAAGENRHRRPLRIQQLRRVRDGDLHGLFEEQLIPAYAGAGKKLSTDISRTVMDMALGLGAAVFERQSRALHLRADALESLSAISCPVTLICGAQDAVCPVEYHQEMARRIPQADLHVLENCGHLSTLEQADEVNRLLLDWLKDDADTSVAA